MFVYVIMVYGLFHNQIGPLPGTYHSLQECEVGRTQQHLEIAYWSRCEPIVVPEPPKEPTK